MSVRATERIVGDLVYVAALPKGPHMVAKAVNEETKIITTVWFSNSNEYQEGTFPASALERVEIKKPAKASAAKAKKK